MAVDIGVMDLPYTMDEATSSNDILFMERASPGVVATNIAAGDFRSAVGTRWYNDVFWAGAYVAGPSTGAIHSASSAAPAGTSEQYGAVARVAGQIVSGKDYSIHLGGDAQWLIQPPRNLIANTQTLTLSDRPELRLDPTTLASTGALANVSGAQVYSVEAAATYGPLILQGEYFWFNVDRNANTGVPPIGAPSAKFQGGYAQAGWVLTGEHRTYNAANAAYNGVKPAHPFSLDGGGWGAWEIAGRFSTIDLNRPAGHGDRHRRWTAERLHAGAQLVRQRQCALHARLPPRQRIQAGLVGLDRGCRLEVRRDRDAHAVRILTAAGVPAAAPPLPDASRLVH